MHEALPFAAWEAFYVIIGTSAAALTGLQFVVIALIADADWMTTSPEIEAFGTPTVVHFCAVLLVSAIISAPWPSLVGADVSIGVTGIAGIFYATLIVRRARRQKGYKPVLEDWFWYAGIPFVAYIALAVSAITLQRAPAPTLFVVGAAVVTLLFVGIHNAWDTVTYIALQRWERRQRPQADESSTDLLRP